MLSGVSRIPCIKGEADSPPSSKKMYFLKQKKKKLLLFKYEVLIHGDQLVKHYLGGLLWPVQRGFNTGRCCVFASTSAFLI